MKEVRELYNIKNDVEFYLYKPDLERCLNDNSIEEIEARDGQLVFIIFGIVLE